MPRRPYLSLLVLILSLLGAQTVTAQQPTSISLKSACVVLPAEPTQSETDAAAELALWLKAITDADTPIGTAPVAGKSVVYLGAAANEASQGLLLKTGSPEGAFALVVEGGRIDIAGVGDGVYFGVCELLEQIGVRWFMPGELGTVLPQGGELAVATQAIMQVPGFTGRHFQMPHADWQRRLRCGGPTFPGAHGLPGISRKNFEDHPEWFALVHGKRVNRQHCVSNPEVIATVVAAAKARFAKNPDMTSLGIGPNDGAGFCECASCTALDTGDYDPFSAEPSVTDRYIWFFKQVLKGIEDEYPDKKIAFYIYHNYMRPPLREEMDPRITGALAPIALCRIHGPNNPVCPEKRYYEQLAADWGKIMPELWERGYWSNLACPGFIFPLVHRLREQIPFGKRAGIYGWRVETFAQWGAQLPGMYIAGKLMWNPDADVDALMLDFYQQFYGPAAGPMQAWHELYDNRLHDADLHTGCSWDIPLLYPPALREQARALLAQAAKLAIKNDAVTARLQMVSEMQQMTDAFCDMMQARVDLDFAAGATALERLDTVATTLKAYDPPMVYVRNYDAYMRRFFRHATEQGLARVTGGNTLITACQDEWDFLQDPAKIGEDVGWWREELTGGNWQRLKTSSMSWSSQGFRYYKGLAWYRQTVTVAPEHAGKRIFLWCGGVDELAKVWVNGKPIGISHGAAMYPFELDATNAVVAGENSIVFCVRNETVSELGTGGILAPVILYAPAKGAEAELENVRDLKPTFP